MPANNLTPAERTLLGRAAANRRWSKLGPVKRMIATQAGRDAMWQRYLAAVPDDVTDPDDRAALARQARRADMQALALRSARARRREAS